MQTAIDILENDILKQYPDVLNILLFDFTTEKNIFWATDNYEHLGKSYHFDSSITLESITGDNGNIIMPRVQKDKILQQTRSKDMAEVFTPSWVCNSQNNLIDNSWFGRKNVFNIEISGNNGLPWKVNEQTIKFPENKTWRDYIKDIRLEVSCGEAPYIASRYDTTTGKFIPVKNRIGILDRKLRVINENIDELQDWLEAVKVAFKSCYGYEWQGDSLLLAREAMLITFIENFNLKFSREPSLESIQNIAKIISWNIWQMDGLKGVIPRSCQNTKMTITNLFGETETVTSSCTGCKHDDINKHNGIYCNIMDWESFDLKTGNKGNRIKFIDLLKNND